MRDVRPNLLFIYSDQHAAAVSGCYGDPVAETPNLDALAARGVLLENVYCPSPICVPSRMSFLSGRYPHENRVWTNNHSLDSSIPTLAHAWGAAGYRPLLVGRMHSNGPDQLRGYADRFVGDHGPNYLGGFPVDHGQLTGTAGPARVSLEKSGIGQSAYEVHDEYVTAATVDLLNRLGIERRSGVATEPFCLSVGLMLPHQPFVARRADYERFEGRVGLPHVSTPFSEDLHPYFRWWRSRCGIEEVTETEILRARTAYWALVYRMDAMIGEMLEALRRNGLEENTLVVYMSDHGEQVGEHGLWWKQTFYEGAVKVPVILAWPGGLPEGVRSNRVLTSMDLNATMIAALGGPALPNSRGRSALELLRGQSDDWEDLAISEFCTEEGCLQRMIRRDEWKLNYYHGQPAQLFNLAEDPDELCDLAEDSVQAETLRALTAELLSDWDPAVVEAEMARKRADAPILRDWARNVQPADQYRWPLRPEMDYLE